MEYHLSIGATLLLWAFPAALLTLIAVHAAATSRRGNDR
jgi:cytochrome c-type biogenesis protein CcmH/NrfF